MQWLSVTTHACARNKQGEFAHVMSLVEFVKSMKSVQEMAADEAAKYDISIREDIKEAFIAGYKQAMKDKIQRKNYDVSYADVNFQDLLITWFEYKRERKETYKSDRSRRMFYNKLLRLSSNDPFKAEQIINTSIANNWAGIFSIKDENSRSNYRESKRDELMHKFAAIQGASNSTEAKLLF